MNAIVKSLRDYFRGTRLIYKLTWIIAIFIIPIAVLTWMLVENVKKEIQFTEKEMLGVEYFQAVRQLAETEVDYRRIANDFTSFPAASDFDSMRTAQARVQNALVGIEHAEKVIGENPHTKGAYEKVKFAFALSKNILASGLNLAAEKGRLQNVSSFDKEQLAEFDDLFATLATIDANATWTAHQKKQRELFVVNNFLFDSTVALMVESADVSNLTLDPVMDSFVLQFWMTKTIQNVHFAGQAQILGLQLLNKPSSPQELRNQYLVLKGKLSLIHDDIYSGWEDFSKERPELAKTMEALYEQQADRVQDFLQCLENKVTLAETISGNRDEVMREGSEAIAATFALYDPAETALRSLLNERLSKLRGQMTFSLASVATGLALVLMISAFIAVRISRQTRELTNTFDQIAVGNYETRARVLAGDETGAVAGNLNQMLDNTLKLIQSREERNSIQSSIMKLLDEVSGVADGDLTQEAEVTADITGAIADAFNYLIAQLRTVIGDVRKTTNQVRATAGDIYGTAHALSERSEIQSRQIVETTARVDQMTSSIQEVSRSASLSANVADQALASAREGNAAVRNTIQGMDRIRDQVQETAKRIKRLGESSQEIGQIVQLIDDIADRTSILALNASIQAAMAGEAGRGFAVVAEEVERLADRSTEATKKISNLVKSIQSETNEAVGAMEKGIQEVIEGSKLATRAGSALGEIESVSQKLAGLLQTISAGSRQQATESEALSQSMAEISEITLDTTQGTKVAASEVNALSNLAEKLRGSIDSFRLPGGMAPAELTVAHHDSRTGLVGANGHSNGNGKSRV